MGKKLNVSLEEAKELIKTMIIASLNDDKPVPPVYIEGKAGEGKSAIMKQLVLELENMLGEWVGYKDWRLSLLSASDLQGIPNLVDSGMRGIKTLQWVKSCDIPSVLNTEVTPKKIPTPAERNSPYLGLSEKFPRVGILMLDEINQVEESGMLSLLYNLLLDKRINDLQIAPKWFLVGAGNRAEDGGVYNRLPAPVRDRMLILNIQVTDLEKLQYFSKSGLHKVLYNYLLEKYNNNQSVLHTYDADLEEDDAECENYVFTTSRSIEMVSDLLRSFEECNNLRLFNKTISNDTFKHMICGLMGEEIGTEFYQYYIKNKNMNKSLSTMFGDDVSIEEILKSLSKIKWSNGQPDMSELSSDIKQFIEGLSKEKLQLLFTSAVANLSPTQRNLSEDEFAYALLYLVYKGVINTVIYNSIKQVINDRQLPYMARFNNLVLETNSQEMVGSILNI